MRSRCPCGTLAYRDEITRRFDINLVELHPVMPREEFAAQHGLDLYDRGYASIDCTPCTRPVLPGEDERAGRWAGIAKTECGIHTFLDPKT